MAIQRKLTNYEIKLLNDLLDGQLEPQKAKEAFARIDQDAALKAAYDHLRWTKSVLRTAPRRRVPHHFMLTRQMAMEARKPVGLQRQTFNIAGLLASLIFVVLLVVQLAPSIAMQNAIPAMDIAMDSVAEEEVAEEKMFESDEAAPEMFQMTLEDDSDGAMAVEDMAVEDTTEEEMMGESDTAESEEMLPPEPTISPYEASGGGSLEGEEQDEGAVLPTPILEYGVGGGLEDMPTENTEAMDTASDEEEGTDRIPEPDMEDMTAMSIPEEEMENEIMALEAPEGMMKEVPEEQQARELRKPVNPLFLATVLAGVLAFIFIFISLRGRKRN